MEGRTPPSPRHRSRLNRWDREAVWHTLRTTIAAVVSLVVARACGLPEAYWAVITTVIVLQSSLGAAWKVSWQRLAGTVAGGTTAALLCTGFASGLLPFAAGMLALGLLCTVPSLGKTAYRFAGITLAIVMLPDHKDVLIWIVALHRLFEVTLGIVVGMVAVAIWPERERPAAGPPPATRGE